MANLCDTQFIITCGSKEPIMNLWESMKEQGAEKGYMPLYQLAEHYGIDYEKKCISVRGHVYWADIEANEEDDLYKLSFDVESAWSPTIELFEEIDSKLGELFNIHYRAIECGCDIFIVHDPTYSFFPEEACVSSSGNPFEDCLEDCFDTVADAINHWSSIMGISQGNRTEDEMLDYINGFEYDDENTYFYINRFVFE